MSERAEAIFEIINEKGLHARAAVKLTQTAQRFPCEVTVAREDLSQSANGKSVMGLILLVGARGTRIQVTAEGPRADEAIEAIGELIAGRFGEPR
jgi:phosphocarrier protein